MERERIGIVGAGAWGTALANVACQAGRRVILWCRRPELAETINRTHENQARLPGVVLDPAVRATSELSEAVDADVVLLTVPAQHLREICQAASGTWRPGVAAVICAKGIEQRSLALLSDVVAETLPAAPVAILSGPSFAIEVARRLPTAVTFASRDPDLRRKVPSALGTRTFRIYTSDDVIGAALGGAVKNVLAIACGIIEGRALGENARAALITRGLAEMVRLGLAKGAEAETFRGLSGLGDLVLTCTARQSRNFSFGVAVGEGRLPAEVLAGRDMVTEGALSAGAVAELASQLRIEMPITVAVDAVINQGADLDEAITGLLTRPFKGEGLG
jgi:glycerol-3-phosphate dehydrogenase (NAD(P)+)